MFEDYIDVRPQSRRGSELGINVLPNGRINLNKKLTDHLQGNKVSVRFRKDGMEVVVFNDDNGFNLPKSGSFKNEEFINYLKEQKIQLPARYNVIVDEDKVFKGKLPNEVISKVKRKWREEKCKDKRREYSRQYYEKNYLEICKKTLGIYCETSIEKIQKTHSEEVNRLFDEFPYEKYGERLIKNVLNQLDIKPNSYEYAECIEAGMMAYVYCINRFAVIKCVYIEAYLNKVIKIYVKCTLIICRESQNICRENKFKLIELDNLDNIGRF